MEGPSTQETKQEQAQASPGAPPEAGRGQGQGSLDSPPESKEPEVEEKRQEETVVLTPHGATRRALDLYASPASGPGQRRLALQLAAQARSRGPRMSRADRANVMECLTVASQRTRDPAWW